MNSVTIKKYRVCSRPGRILKRHYGVMLQAALEELDAFSKLKVPEGVFKGVSNIPDEKDIVELKNGFEKCIFRKREFLEFCREHSLEESTESKESANQFLEFKQGRLVAWLNVPVDYDYLIVKRVFQITKRCNLAIIEPEDGEELIIPD
jgi:hypothetical protein